MSNSLLAAGDEESALTLAGFDEAATETMPDGRFAAARAAAGLTSLLFNRRSRGVAAGAASSMASGGLASISERARSIQLGPIGGGSL